MEFGKTRDDCFHDNASKNNINLKKVYAEKFRDTTVIEIQGQNCGGNRKLSIEGIAIEYFPNSIDPGVNKKSEFHSYISDKNEQYACDSHAQTFHLVIYFESGMLVPVISTVWEETYGCS